MRKHIAYVAGPPGSGKTVFGAMLADALHGVFGGGESRKARHPVVEEWHGCINCLEEHARAARADGWRTYFVLMAREGLDCTAYIEDIHSYTVCNPISDDWRKELLWQAEELSEELAGV